MVHSGTDFTADHAVDSDSEDEVGAQAPTLTRQISNILKRYPEGGQILKELIQNADDAQATKVAFLIDWRHHPTEDVMFPNFEKYQGPALYAWNNAVFEKKDWHSLAKISQSSKEDDVSKAGRFGLGFQSVFHITDIPMVISQEHVAVIDPHLKCVNKKSATSPAGTKKKLSSFFEHRGHVSTFKSMFNVNTKKVGRYSGTIFRFPLRQSGSNSEISNKVYTPKMIQTMLFESLKEESPYILLFLQNVKSISLMEWLETSPVSRETFKVELIDYTHCNTTGTKATQSSLSEQSSKQRLQSLKQRGLENYVAVKSASVSVTDHSSCATAPTTHHWLVLKSHGTSDTKLLALGKELLVLPWVGLATKLPVPVSLPECKFNASLLHSDSSVVRSVLKELEIPLLQARQLVPWSIEATSHSSGRAFCFLPLPEITAMPVHVHGYFAVTDNRRSIKWPAHDEKGKEAQWNRELLNKMVAPSYALLLACRASLIQYDQPPVLITNTNKVTDAYSAWPIYAEVKNIHIWSELLSPTLELLNSLPLLWTAAYGGKWVQFSEAYFLPGTFSNSSCNCSCTVIQLLIKLNIPVVSVPSDISETIKQSKQLREIVESQEISPRLVRRVIKENPECCTSLEKKHVYNLLVYVLQDLDEGTYFALIGIPLLPLKGISSVVMFEMPNNHNHKYIFTPKLQPLIDVIPGANSLVVDPEVPSEAVEMLCQIATTGFLQLMEVNEQILCKQLLPGSIKLWCMEKTEVGYRWTPGKGLMPPQSWLNALWKWIREYSVSLSNLQELPIVPLIPFDESQREEVILIEPKGIKTLCCLSVPFTPKDKTMLISILRKFDFLIADKSRMNSCDSWMNEHPDFKKYIPELSSGLELLLQYLNQLDSSHRMQIVERLESYERDFLRTQFTSLYDSCAKYCKCLRSLPIYHAASVHQPRFVAIESAGSSREAFLPPENIPPLPEYPTEMLQSVVLPGEKEMFKTMKVKQLSISELCTDYLIPMALKYIQTQPSLWSVGDDVVLWILKLRKLDKNVIKSLSESDIVCSGSNIHKKPRDMLDPQDHDPNRNLMTLFNIDVDRDRFPNEKYFKEPLCRQSLIELGMKTWKCIQKNDIQLCALLQDRMRSISSLEHSAQLKRGAFILKILVKPENCKVLCKNMSLVNIPFLYSESFPSHFPHVLMEKWCGQEEKLYSIEELCLQTDHVHNLVGTVRPILSHNYSSGRHWEFMAALQKFAFQKITELDVLKQLKNLESVLIGKEDVDKFDHIVMSVYQHLHTHSCSQSLQLIWCRLAETPGFLPANRFVLELPDTLKDHLEPFYYFLQSPIRKYANLFDIRDSLTTADVAGVIKSTKESYIDLGKKLTNKQIDHCLSVLYWLYEKRYKESGMLILTEQCTLLPAVQCVFDDRSWTKGSQQSQLNLKTSPLCFVHDRVPTKVAKHFQVTPLSHKVFPSQNVGISYVKVGQHEEITHRIKRIVDDYENDIDIFKELIQNADDAGATEIKFLIDWRHHPTESLIAEELKEWQGPALIAYNNATFSDEDFDNICEVAGETKKDDPFKIGRFGVGFCVTYHLTDLPSFVSRRYFTVFDSHTTYLGDRVSANAPGMRIDLIENKESLQLYRDQFIPYEGLFNCNIFDLGAEGEYPGTLFRFPFRSSVTSQRSKISKKIYDKRSVTCLFQALNKKSHELLLFLKNINKVSLYELDQGCSPSKAKEVFSVNSTVESSALSRTELIRNSKSYNSKSCSTKISIRVQDATKDVQNTWLVSTAIGICPSDLQQHPEAKGLLPLAEVAIKIEPSTDHQICKPIADFKYGTVFCFLPLPITIPLPFHMNGFFSVGKDRRNISVADDKSFGSLWNQSLAKGALVDAFINLLSSLCNKCNLSVVADPEIKHVCLRSYYDLWRINSVSGVIGDNFTTAFKRKVSTQKCPMIWSEINGGCWLPPTNISVFRDSMLRHESKQVIVKDAFNLLLQHGVNLVDLPEHVYEILMTSLISSGNVYDYEHFFIEYLFPNIAKISSQIRNRNIKFLLEEYEMHFGKDTGFQWAKNVLCTSPCIPCQGPEHITKISQLIDPSNELLKSLFDSSEGRFPCEDLQSSLTAMQCLRKLGMVSCKLSLDDLVERVKSVTDQNEDFELALGRSQNICAYISSIYSVTDNLTELQKLLTIPFVPVKEKPSNVDVPWCGKVRSFASPSQLFSSKHEGLIFSQHPVVEDTSTNVAYVCLGITSKRPSFEMIMAHLSCIIEFVHSKPKLNDTTIMFLDKSMKELYCYIQEHHYSAEEVKQLLQLDTFIWQDRHFLCPSQVVGSWNHDKVPYLCQLTKSNQQFLNLFGVKSEATVEMLVHVLEKIAKDHGSNPLPDDVFEFVEFTSGQLEKQVPNEGYTSSVIYLPDEEKIMRETSVLADNVSLEWIKTSQLYNEFVKNKNCILVHKSIPQERAIKLGVNRLSHLIFPSYSVHLKYTKVGQHEEITHRLKRLVDDYDNDIDVFKELIQNADDAGATEVKFLIDWRHHPTESLIADELKEWQGPALIAYNNATFSDGDFDSICQVAGETKKDDPFKIGRFGVGFCATYHLTDLPSFISRRYFTMFDSHTSYLGDRVSAEAPGMRVDLIENNDSLQLYHDQLSPYEGLFDCNIFDLKAADGYPGTMFRFPFRTPLTSQKSKICKKIYDKKRVSELVKALKDQSYELLIFLKGVSRVSLYELDEQCDPSAAKEIFSVECTVENSKPPNRTELIKNCTSLFKRTKTCLTNIHIRVHDNTNDTKCTWMISSAIGTCPPQLKQCPEAKGLLPLAEVAIRVDPATNKQICKPITGAKYGKVFCFLPLPITVLLPFHVNGFFSVGKDRRNISATDDQSFGSLWNQSLAEGALVTAFIHLLSSLCSKCKLSDVPDPVIKQDYLRSYYTLWNFSGASGLIGDKLTSAFCKHVLTQTCPMIWSEIKGGRFLPPTKIMVFKDNLMGHELKEIIKKDACEVLLEDGLNIADLPEHVYEILKTSLSDSGRVYDYRKFCIEHFFPNITKINREITNRNIKFLLEQYGKHSGKDNCFQWAENFLTNSPCIPCEGSKHLRQVSQLIDPSIKLLESLFDVSEGRFPSRDLQTSKKAMKCLRSLKMCTELSIGDLEGRAKSVTALQDYELATKRSQHLCAYIASKYSGPWYSPVLVAIPELQPLLTIPFLPVKEKQENVEVPWYGKFQSFESPSHLYSPKCEHLIFSQHPVVMEGTNSKACACLKINSKQPPFQSVIAHLKCVVSEVVQCESKLSDITIQFLNESMKVLYGYIHTHSSPQNVQQLLQLETFIWQKGHFLSPSQVVGHWNHDCIPYLCQLTEANKPFSDLFGVKSEATLEMLVHVLYKIAKDHDTLPISDTVLEFVEFTSGQLERKIHISQSLTIYLPDNNKIMHETSLMADNVSTEWMRNSQLFQDLVSCRNYYLIHESIPQERAVKLGVKPLSHVVFPTNSVPLMYNSLRVVQHGEITRKLKNIVDNFDNDTDIFKELIQNANDAGATEIKFLIDWRQHPTVSLIAEDLKEWQGPALIACNNATFSDEDFDNICNIAGETKKDNPFKIGRFGVGLCATYHLTDLPSFISRRYFTMFDSHTLYLGDRVSTESPVLKVDLLENKDSLQLYHDQFVPYQGLFGCNIFDLNAEDGYAGTLFRFPFRTLLASQRSKISKRMYNKNRVSGLVQALKDQSHELLIFLKHINRVSLYELDEGCSPSPPKEVFSVECTVGSSVFRNELIKKCPSRFKLNLSKKSCLTEFNIEARDETNERQYSWIVSSAVGACSSDLKNHAEAKGLLPFAEVAINVAPLTNEKMCKPITDSVNGKVFCFLPLPITIQLPFHVNGYFSIGKHCKSISATGGKSFGSLWNQSLVEGALVEAFIHLLNSLCSKCNLSLISDPEIKQNFLCSYYALWNCRDVSGSIGDQFALKFKDCVPTEHKQKIIWSEIDGGRWLPPTEIVLFWDNILKRESKTMIEKDAFELLLQHGLSVADLPEHVYEILQKSLNSHGKEYDYEKFCTKHLFPKISKINPEVRHRNIVFLVEHHGKEKCFQWAENFLSKSPCIPCEGSKTLRPAQELIDPRSKQLESLYDVSEGRFPCKDLQSSSDAMECLKMLGMTTKKLSVSDLKDRTTSVANLEYEFAVKRSQHICDYIASIYGTWFNALVTIMQLSHENITELQQLLNIPFLPVKEKPPNVDVPWYGKSYSFECPARLYSPDVCESLIFSQNPVVVETINTTTCKCLGITSKFPTFESVIAHLKCVITYIVQIETKPNDDTAHFLDKSMLALYKYIKVHHSSPQEVKQLLQLENFIWQEGQFLSPNQVVENWGHNCVPYLCQLTIDNRPFSDLFGVKDEATHEMLVQVLQKISQDHDAIPITDKVLEFVVFTSGQLEQKIKPEEVRKFKIYLPDDNKIMRETSLLADNIGGDWVMHSKLYTKFLSGGTGYLVHESIPRKCAINLGVNPLIDALLKEIEDHDFLNQTEFRRCEDHALCNHLDSVIKSYPADTAIFKEFIQNADVSHATEIVFVLDHRINFSDNTLVHSDLRWKSLQHTPALCVIVNKKYTATDIESLANIGDRDKPEELVSGLGIGFNVAYHVTDCPSLVVYAEGGHGAPECLCIFDPTRSFVPHATKWPPGRKWNFKDKDQYLEFTDQFQPYLKEDVQRLSQCVPNCLPNFEKCGYVVFRLPLTRFSTKLNKLHQSLSVNKLISGHTFSPSSMSMLFEEFVAVSQDMLLFLNHIKSVSAFEIRQDGSLKHHFTSTASIPSPYKQEYESFPTHVKNCTKRVSLMHRVEIAHTQPEYSCVTQWIVQRAVDKKGLKPKTLKGGLYHDLVPVGGVAAPVESLPNHTRNLFCMCPLPVILSLPVHINGHFLVDSSRKQLETSVWNESLTEKVIAPAYIEFIIAISKSGLIDAPDTKSWFYSLFPKPNLPVLANKVDRQKTGNNAISRIPRLFYGELLLRNPSILILEEPSPSLTCHWMSVRSCLFCVPYVREETKEILSVSGQLRSALVSLGLKITIAPNIIHQGCSEEDKRFSELARVEPEKVVKHLRNLKLTTENKGIIKGNIQCLLEYCIAGYGTQEIPQLFSNSLYLVAKDKTLQRGVLFRSQFSDLLPHKADRFADPTLEKSKIGELLQFCQVICTLPLKYVSDNINLPDSKTLVYGFNDVNLNCVKLLWEFFINRSQASHLATIEQFSSQLIKLFSTKVIIPTEGDRLYPICLSKALVRSSSGRCNNCRVMKKLGYMEIDFKKLEITNKSQLNTIVNSLTSCFTDGEDIVDCLKLSRPQNIQVQLSDGEATSFAVSLGRASSNHLQQISGFILEMPLFYAADGSRISLHGVTKVFILTSVSVPLDGVPILDRGQAILKITNTEAINNLYESVIPKKAYVDPQGFYLQLVLPILPNLELDTAKKHIKHLFAHRQTMSTAWDKLKNIPFIWHNNQFCKVSNLCDHRVEFFSTFMQECVLPTSWHDRIHILEHLGFHSTVTNEEFLQCARKFCSEVIDDMSEYRSGVLLNQLIKMTKIDSKDSRSFLQKVADIKFLYSSEAHELEMILSHMFPEEHSSVQNKFKFSGSVTTHEANTACLCKAVLPKSCQPLLRQSFSRHALRIEHPVAPKTVAENLKCLCKRVSVNCMRSPSVSRKQVTKLIDIFEKHYAYLSDKKPPQSVLRELTDVMCILRTNTPLLQLVKPIQLVVQLPLNCSLEPYCYRVSPWLQKYMDFLVAVGVRQELKVQDYIDILASIHKEHNGDTSCNTDKNVIETAYRELIHHLRQESQTIRRLSGVVYLPDESMCLKKSTALCLNDAPWYRSRLPPNCALKIILQPPVDDKGHRTLPDVLRIKRLSEIVTERMQESCKSPDFRCTDEELFAVGRRPESGRCVFVRNILETLKSDQLFEGLCRMYYTEHKCPPTRSFERLANKLKQVPICCINTEIKTVLCFNDEVIQGTEDSSKLCHLTTDKKLVISPHNKHIDGSKFLKDLASCICKLINNEIKNMVPIAAVFGCHPSEIRQVLTREQICEYMDGNIATSEAISIGSPVQWKGISPQDSVIILNSHPKDVVCYICDDGSLKNAEVLRCESVNETAFDFLEPVLTIRAGEIGTKQNDTVTSNDSDGDNDAASIKVCDSDDSEEFFSASEGTVSDDEEFQYGSDVSDGKRIDYSDPAILRVSPIRIIQVMSISQRRSLWGGATSAFACPVTLARVAVDSLDELEQWIDTLYDSQLFTSQSGLIKSLLTLRLLGHLYHQLVVCKKAPILFDHAIHKVSNTFRYMTTMQTSQQEQSVTNILTKILKDAPNDIKRLFPTEVLGEILDITSMLHPNQANNTSHHIPSGSSNSSNQTFPSLGVLLGNLQRYMNVSNWLPNLSRRRGNRNSQIHQVSPQASRQPKICMGSAKAWLLQAKADFCAAQSLFLSHTENESPEAEASTGVRVKCEFPALVCFLCHDTVEKSIKGVLYTFCGLEQGLINCSNLVMLYDALDSSPHRPRTLMKPIKECVMIVNRHENRSRFPNYHNPPCAPVSMYHLKDAQEAFAATKRLLHCLISEETLKEVIGDLKHIPTVIPTTVLQSLKNSSEYIPEHWKPMKEEDEVKLFLLDPMEESDEYERVASQFLLTLPNANILRVERIQNKMIIRRYFHRSQLMKEFGALDLREELLFHGTRYNHPELIYMGGEGFDMRFCLDGMWGRGNYFAVNSSYSHEYAYEHDGVFKMFAVNVLTGNSYCSNPDRSLTKPPFLDNSDPSDTTIQRRYDSIHGTTGGTRVYITYDNEHAYPAYIITYTLTP